MVPSSSKTYKILVGIVDMQTFLLSGYFLKNLFLYAFDTIFINLSDIIDFYV